jgi:hypothetical protein
MNVSSRLASAACASLLLCSPAGAQTPNDENNFFGDRISFPVNVRGQIYLGADAKPSPLGEAVCIPAGQALRVGSKNSIKVKTTVNGQESERTGRVVYVSSFFDETEQCDKPAGQKGKPLAKEKIFLGEREFENTGIDRFGATYGGLVVPFKYHVNGSKEFRAGSAIGPYVGYRFDRNTIGWGAKLIAFAALSTVAVEQNVDGTVKTQSLSGFSYGIGMIGQVKGDFQLGVVVGWDRVSKSANYADNGKAWVALTAGFDFLK